MQARTPPPPELSATDVLARVDALRFQFSCPGTDLEQFAGALRHRARSRRMAIMGTTAVILVSTLVLRRGALRPVDAVLYGTVALLFALGSDKSRREEAAAAEVDWLRARLAELQPDANNMKPQSR